MSNNKKIAWGVSKLLKMYLGQAGKNPFSYCIDDFSSEKSIGDMPVKKSSALSKEKKGSFQVVIFAVSNKSLQEISQKLNTMGLSYGKDFIFYSDFFYDNFLEKAEKKLGFKLDPKIYRLALSSTLNSKVLSHTTILGTWLFLELLNHLNNVEGEIAEVGIFEGGNALCGLDFMTKINSKEFYLFDSFEGFPKLSEYDPKTSKKGDLKTKSSLEEIYDRFSVFPQAILIKGFVPDTFIKIPKDKKFSLVFFDCDLYQPALDTLEFFWDKMAPGGYLLLHDYEVEKGGFTGVKKATDEFSVRKGIKHFSFFENTMAVIKK